MSRPTSIVIAVAIWAIGLIPAVAVAMWLGMVEATWLGALKAAIIVTLVVVVFEWLERWIARRWFRRGES
jgi:hypothetical protein